MARDQNRIGAWIVGSEFIQYRIRLAFRSLLHMALVGGIVMAAAYFALPYALFGPHQRETYSYYRWGRVFDALLIGHHPLLKREVVIGATDLGRLTPSEMVQALGPLVRDDALGFEAKLNHYYAATLTAFVLGCWLWTRIAHRTGHRLQADKFLRGQTLVSADALATTIRRSDRGVSRYSLANVPVPARAQMQNFGFFGSMGSGKSQGIMLLADQVARAAKKMILYDKTGEYLQAFYRPDRDLILNPLDSRSVQWNLFAEIRDIFDPDMLAAALIPPAQSNNPTADYFLTGARVVFSQSLQKLWRENRRTTEQLCNVLLRFGPTEFSLWLDQTEAAAYISDKAMEQAMGVISTLTGQIRALQFTGAGHFSIRDFLAEPDSDQRLFITSGAAQHDVLRPLISMYMDVALRAAMSGPKSPTEDRLWIFLDELGSLHRLPSLETALTEARKFGVCTVVGLQNIAQLREHFGEDLAVVLRSNLQNSVIFRVHDGESEDTLAKYLGRGELDENSANLTYGVSDSRDGQGLQRSRNDRDIVTASQIQTLPDQAGYLKLAGDYPVVPIRYAHKRWLNPAIPEFLPRPDIAITALDRSRAMVPMGSDAAAVTDLRNL